MIEYTVKVRADGTKEWYLNDKLHREDGPAIEFANGDKSWYLNGKLHREDGPAVEYASGSKSWYLNGKLHREEEHKRIAYSLYATLGKTFGLLLGIVIKAAISVVVAVFTLEMIGVQLRWLEVIQ